jgi:CheY-like chemotaxis protein
MSTQRPILVSDDEPLLASSLKRLMRRYSVPVLSDCVADVVELASRERPCLVLLDMIQDRDGLELLAELRGDERTRDIPVVVISAVDNAIIRRKSLEAGALGFVAKPFFSDFPEALAKLAELLSTPDGAATARNLPFSSDFSSDSPRSH